MTTLPRDVYLLMTKYQNDKDVINMLSVNKTYNNSVFFQQIFKQRYPYLVQYKKGRESWKEFYLRMIFYLSYLKEKRDVDYINVPSFDPILLYKKIKENYNIFNYQTEYIGETGDKTLINNFIQKEGEINDNLLQGIARSGNLNLFKHYKIPLEYIDKSDLIMNSVRSGNEDMINYSFDIYDKEDDPMLYAMKGASYIGDIKKFEYYEMRARDLQNYDYDSFLLNAVKGRKLDMIKYLIEKRKKGLNAIGELFYKLYYEGHTDIDLEIFKYLLKQLAFHRQVSTMSAFKNETYKNDKDIREYVKSYKY